MLWKEARLHHIFYEAEANQKPLKLTFSRKTFVDNVKLNWAVNIGILLNMVLIGAQADFPDDGHDGLVYGILECGILVIFLVEMVAKITILKMKYFFQKMNCFDGFLVLMA